MSSSPTMPGIKDGYVYPMEGPGLGVDLLPAVFERSDLTVRRSQRLKVFLRCPPTCSIFPAAPRW